MVWEAGSSGGDLVLASWLTYNIMQKIVIKGLLIIQFCCVLWTESQWPINREYDTINFNNNNFEKQNTANSFLTGNSLIISKTHENKKNQQSTIQKYTK